ncbi:hypothetical protein RIF29_07700 [Crotalaria pallida]|uniref:Uncharacterized protein n=1 Tax=Crotalaria pallida TaxID=3830 RepID=A0AAN9PC30_CROPI
MMQNLKNKSYRLFNNCLSPPYPLQSSQNQNRHCSNAVAAAEQQGLKMASSVEKKSVDSSAVEEAVSVELPAPPGWKKKVHFSFTARSLCLNLNLNLVSYLNCLFFRSRILIDVFFFAYSCN